MAQYSTVVKGARTATNNPYKLLSHYLIVTQLFQSKVLIDYEYDIRLLYYRYSTYVQAQKLKADMKMRRPVLPAGKVSVLPRIQLEFSSPIP
jgi:hypothetical protein